MVWGIFTGLGSKHVGFRVFKDLGFRVSSFSTHTRTCLGEDPV